MKVFPVNPALKSAWLKIRWLKIRRAWRSIGADLIKTMVGLILFTSLTIFVVLGYVWTSYFKLIYTHGIEILSKRFQIPTQDIETLFKEIELRTEATFNLSDLKEPDQVLLFFLILLTFLLPALLAGWAARRFARPLNHLSTAARHLTTGDFSARVPLTTHLERREDETALLLKDFNKMATALQQLEHERRYSLAAIAHELRTPVTVLRGRLEGVRDGVLAANPAEFDKLLGHADLLTQLIEDLQLLSLAEAGELRLERADLVLQELLHRLCSDYQIKAEQQDTKLHLQMPSELAR